MIKEFSMGADGVLVFGCHPNDCHYTDGNFYALGRLRILKGYLPFVGIYKRRFSYQWVSASEDQKWQGVVTSFGKNDKEHSIKDEQRND